MKRLRDILAAGLVVTGSAFALAGPAQAASGIWDRAWGEDVDSMAPGLSFEICVTAISCKTGIVSGPALAGDLNNPQGVATDPAGNVYAADTDHNRVQKFGSSGAFERAWGEDVASPPGSMTTGFEVCVAGVDLCKTGETTGAALGGELNGPTGVATDAAGNVYVADNSHNRIQKFNAMGVFERAWGEDVVSTGPGNTGNFEICVAANGDTCKTGEAAGAALGGELNGPRGIATDAAGNVYVNDSHHNRVQKFNSLGAFERAWGEDVVATGPGNMGTGFEVCVAANGDTCKTGLGFGAFPARGGELAFPDGLATDAAGNVYVGDSNHNRVQKFNALGAFERTWGEDVLEFGPGGLGGGNFEICVAANGDTCKAGVQTPPALGGEFIAPSGVATDTAGKVYVADFGHHRVQRFSASGVFERAWGEDVASAGPGNAGVGFEVCVATSEVCKTGETTAPALGGELNFPNGLATDAAGNLYVADTGHHRIQRFADPVVTPPPAGGGASPPAATGRRATALKKCKKKKRKARKKCIKKAKKLPV